MAAGPNTGTNAFSGSYKLNGAWVAPANGFHRDISFYYDGSTYGELFRSSADIAN